MSRRNTPLTTGEKRGLIAVAAIALAAITVTILSRENSSQSIAADTQAVESAKGYVLSMPDSLATDKEQPKAKNGGREKTKNKKSKQTTPINQPRERSFLDEK